MRIPAAELARINSFPKLIDVLRDHLEWPIGENYGFEEVVFEYEARELGLKPEETAKIREIHQLRPLARNQPWGIFFVSFEEKTLSVTVLRRILRSLVVKKRAGTQSSDRQAWDKSDLIFATNFGRSGDRELAFVHFSDGAASNDLPVMKVLGWNAKDTGLHNDYVGQTLTSKLRWPEDLGDSVQWRKDWSAAFELRLNETIRTAKDLAIRLATLGSEIRARVNELLGAETDDGPMRSMLAAFQKNLIHDLDDDGFADMFAQTIAYGMLAARISRPMGIIADNLADMVPKTNPFLKELFGNFLRIGGRDKRTGLDFDELGVRDIVDMLNGVDMEAVKRDFGNRNPKKDPVIHFYEDFLYEYDRAQKVDAGIFYTPPAVVAFIVRGVDEMLRTEFGLPLGLADTSTWAEVAEQNDRITVPAHVKSDAPFVQILDPATGTGTFLVEVIDLIHKRMVDHWQGQGKSAAEIKAAWNAYVPAHLLPRLTAFELKMAAYAIAHMKLGLKLTETGYAFGSDERLHVLLTNSLQPPTELDLEERMRLEAMAHEAERANFAKQNTPFTVVIGNPPYKGHSMNPSKVRGKLTFAGEIIQRFFQVRGEPLGEKNPKWLNNDYVKFIGLAMMYIERTGVGVLGYITSNSWLDGPTFRGVRTELSDSFPTLFLVDLHGNTSRAEIASDGSRDEGVFAISEGTAIHIGVRLDKSHEIFSKDLVGQFDESDDGKLTWLEKSNLRVNITNHIIATPPLFLFVPSINKNKDEYYRLISIRDIFSKNSVGFATANDNLAIHFDDGELDRLANILIAADLDSLNSERLRKQNPDDWRLHIDAGSGLVGLKNKPEAEDWRLDWARDDMIRFLRQGGKSTQVRYRPFDDRFTYYTGSSRGFMCRPRPGVLGLLDGSDTGQVALLTSRMTKGEEFAHVHLTKTPAEVIGLSPKTSNNAFVFPLWLKLSGGDTRRRPNINRGWALDFGKAIELFYEDGIPRGEQRSSGPDPLRTQAEQIGLIDTSTEGRGDLQRTFGPGDLFDYIYAVLHSPGYRSRYAEFLKSDFPRIPTPEARTTFAALATLGRQLVGLHLLRPEDAPILKSPDTRFAGNGEARVERGYPEYKNGKVMINASRWFEDVPKATWEFHVGGYQVCEKWLKDRAGKGGKSPSAGRVLTDEEVLHYRRVVVALTETRRLMDEIDAVIDRHGGWPSAFYVPPPPPPTIEQIIKADEGQELEYKSTLQFDLKEATKSKLVRKAALKTIVAFLNSGKGALVIGVSDEKEIVGLEPDFSTMSPEKRTREWFQQTLVNLINEQIGSEFAPLYEVRFATHDEKMVAIVDVKERAPKPAYLEDGGTQEFYVRTSNLTKQLKNEEIDRYIGTHWRG